MVAPFRLATSVATFEISSSIRLRNVCRRCWSEFRVFWTKVWISRCLFWIASSFFWASAWLLVLASALRAALECGATELHERAGQVARDRSAGVGRGLP